MNKDERAICENILARTQVGEIAWELKPYQDESHHFRERYIATVDGMSIELSEDSGPMSFSSWYLLVKEGDGSWSMGQSLGASWLRCNILRTIFELVDSSRQANRAIARRKIVSKLKTNA